MHSPAPIEQGANKVGATMYFLAGICALTASAVTFYTMFLHLKNYRRPDLQRVTIRILWMVPVYAFASFVSLSSLYASHYIDTIRDVYEAFVIYSFFTLLINYLGGERALLDTLQQRLRIHHFWPFNYCFSPMDMSDPDTFLFIRRGVLQFVIIKPLHAIFIMLLKTTGHYEEGYVAWDSSYVYLSFAYNISVCWSMYCLVLFYVQCSRDLQPYRPVPKFVCVKAIVFLTFWQGILVAFLVAAGAIRERGEEYSANNIALAIQDVVICFEMPFFAWAHYYAFPWTDYDDSRLSSRLTLRHALKDALGIKDIVRDTYTTFIDPPNFTRPHHARNRQYLHNPDIWNDNDNQDSDDGLEGGALAEASERTYFGSSGYSRLYLSPALDTRVTPVEFNDPDEEEEIDYIQARQFTFGDPNFPVMNEDPRYHHPPQVQRNIQRHTDAFNAEVARRSGGRFVHFVESSLTSSTRGNQATNASLRDTRQVVIGVDEEPHGGFDLFADVLADGDSDNEQPEDRRTLVASGAQSKRANQKPRGNAGLPLDNIIPK